MGLREIESPAQAHIAENWQSQDLKSDESDYKVSMIFAFPKVSGTNFLSEWMCRKRKR